MNQRISSGDNTAQISAFSEIETLIRARYPLIYVSSWEENRVIAELDELTRRLGKRLFCWSINDGMRPVGSGVSIAQEGKKGTKDPLIAMREVMQASDPSVFVFLDFHPYMKESAITRGLRDIAEQLRTTYSSVVLISSQIEIPSELEKDITLVDYPLPCRKDLEELLESIAADLSSNPNLSVDFSNGGKEELVSAAIGLTLNEAENVFAKTLVSKRRLSHEEVSLVFSEKEQIIRKTGLLEYIHVSDDFGGIGGLDRLKEWLAKRHLAFGEDARNFGLDVPKGVLILGIQGCGKSLCAKAVPRLWNIPLLRLDMGRLFGSLVGSSEQNVRRALRLAESVEPVVLWIDEIDKGFSGLDSSSASDSGTTARVFGTILTWLQEKTSSVFVIATANNVEVLPPELLRKGRFDEIFFVDLPNAIERESIFNIHLKRRKRNPEKFNIKELATISGGYSGAEIEQAIVSALFDAFAEKRDITTEHVAKAIKETVPLSKMMGREINERREWAKGRTRQAT